MFLDGNGFKTSTMRLGADVIVFSRATHERYCLLLFLVHKISTAVVMYWSHNFC